MFGVSAKTTVYLTKLHKYDEMDKTKMGICE